MAILISPKIEFQTKKPPDIRGAFCNEKRIDTSRKYTGNNDQTIDSKIHETEIDKIEGEIDNSTICVGEFNIHFE